MQQSTHLHCSACDIHTATALQSRFLAIASPSDEDPSCCSFLADEDEVFCCKSLLAVAVAGVDEVAAAVAAVGWSLALAPLRQRKVAPGPPGCSLKATDAFVVQAFPGKTRLDFASLA